MSYQTKNYARAKLVGRWDLDDGLAIFSLEPSEDIQYKPGQYLTLSLDDGRILRPYSVALSDGMLNFYIRRVDRGGRRPDGRGMFTTELFSIPKGYELGTSGAKGHFVLDENDRRGVLFISSGTGLAPITTMLGHLYKQGTKRRVTLLHGMRYLGDIVPYLEYFDGFARDSGFDFNFVPVVSRDADWTEEKGHVQDVLKQPEAEDKLKMTFNPQSTVIYACGLSDMIKDVSAFFEERGFKTRQQLKGKERPDIVVEKY